MMTLLEKLLELIRKKKTDTEIGVSDSIDIVKIEKKEGEKDESKE